MIIFPIIFFPVSPKDSAALWRWFYSTWHLHASLCSHAVYSCWNWAVSWTLCWHSLIWFSLVGLTFVYFYLSESITMDFLEIGDLFYNSSWHRLPAKQQKRLAMAIQQAQRELRLTAIGLFDCSLVVFASVSFWKWTKLGYVNIANSQWATYLANFLILTDNSNSRFILSHDSKIQRHLDVGRGSVDWFNDPWTFFLISAQININCSSFYFWYSRQKSIGSAQYFPCMARRICYFNCCFDVERLEQNGLMSFILIFLCGDILRKEPIECTCVHWTYVLTFSCMWIIYVQVLVLISV